MNHRTSSARTTFLRTVAAAAAIAAGAATLPPAALAGPVIPRSAPIPSANDRYNAAGPEARALAKLAGRWKVTETLWPAPGAAPVRGSAVVAVRRMVGATLEETPYASRSISPASIVRIDYLTYNRIEGHWQYVSLDARAPVGIMPASSFGRDPSDRITVTFSPFAVPGPGKALTGQLLRMDELVTVQSAGANQKDQYFSLADGTGRAWLAHRYAYAR